MRNPDCPKCVWYVDAKIEKLCQNMKLIEDKRGAIGAILKTPPAFCAEFKPKK